MKFKLLKYSILIVGLFICSCDFNANTSLMPKAVKGVLDLSNWDFDKDGHINLSGEYAFYWNQLYQPQDFSSDSVSPKTGFINVPGFWHKFTSHKVRTTPDGYATYHLKILLNPNRRSDSLAIKYMDMGTAFNLFLNGENVCSVGTVGKTSTTSHPMYHPGVADFHVDRPSLELNG